MKRCKYLFKHVLVKFLFLILLTALYPVTASAQSVQEINKNVEDVVLAENWEKAAKLLDDIKPETPSSVIRLIKGHATLALNRNNESLCLFLSVASSETDLKEWEKWTQDFTNKNPKNPIAYYLKGDAFARLEKWDEALTAFNKALELNPKHAMVLNARGVVYVAKKQWDNAIVDFTKATVLNDSFADAYANLGTLAIHRSEGAHGALEDFNEALKLSNDFAIASYSRGSVKLVLGNWKESREDIENATNSKECLNGLIRISLSKIIERINVAEEMDLAKVKSDNPGFEIQTRLDAMGKNRNIGAFGTDLKNVIDLGRKYPEHQPMINNKLSQMARVDPILGDHIKRGLSAIDRHIEVGKIIGGAVNNLELGGKGRFGAGGIVPGAAGVIGGTGDVSVKPKLTQDFMNKMDGYQSGIRDIQRTLPSGANPSGFKTGIEEATWDEGNWPFDPLYGLFYIKVRGK